MWGRVRRLKKKGSLEVNTETTSKGEMKGVTRGLRLSTKFRKKKKRKIVPLGHRGNAFQGGDGKTQAKYVDIQQGGPVNTDKGKEKKTRVLREKWHRSQTEGWEGRRERRRNGILQTKKPGLVRRGRRDKRGVKLGAEKKKGLAQDETAQSMRD